MIRSIWKNITVPMNLPFFHYPATQQIYLMGLGVITGVLGGLGAVLFRWSIELVQYVAYGSSVPLGHLFFVGEVGTIRLVLAPLAAALLIGPITWYYLETVRGAGVPELLESITRRNGRMGWFVFPAKLFVSSLSLGTIASVGREGPIVQIGSSLGAMLNRIVQLPRKHWRVITACGGAAGLSATFNTPVGGAFFMLEVVLGSFSAENFAPIVIASVTGTVVGQRFFGAQPAFRLMEKFSYEHPAELFVYAVLGIVGGVLTFGFIKTVQGFRKGFDRLPLPDTTKPVVGAGFLVAIALFLFPQTAGVGYETIEQLIGAQTNAPDQFLSKTAGVLCLLLLFKMLAVGISLGAGFSGGVFSPSLFLGAGVGYVVGLLANQQLTLDIAPPEAYAIAGMGTIFAGTANAPVSTLIIIFEMTQDYQIVLPLMISCSISTILARLLTSESIYTGKLIRKGIDIHQTPEELVMEQLKVKDVMRSVDEEPLLRTDSTFREITQAFLSHRADHLFVVDDSENVEGVISLHKITKAFSDIDQVGALVRAVDVMDEDVPLISRDASLTEAMNELWRTDYDELPVVEGEDDPRLIGVVWEHDIIGVYNREILKQKASLLKTVGREEQEEETDYLELPGGYTVDQIYVPSDWVGQTLRELGLREKYDIMVVEIKRNARYGDPERMPAKPDVELSQNDALILMGPEKEIDSLRGEKS